MENITEVLVKKKRTGADEAKSFGVVLIAFVLSAFSVKFLGPACIIAIAALVYLAYRIQMYFDLEFEYCVVDKEIRIDKILGRKKRKDFVIVEGDQIEFIVKKTEVNTHELKGTKVYFAAETENDSDNYVIKANKGGLNFYIIIKGDEKMIAHINRVMPGKVRAR